MKEIKEEYLRVQYEIYDAIDSLYYEAHDIHFAWTKTIAERELMRGENKIKGKDKTHYELKLTASGVGFSLYWYRVFFEDVSGKKKRRTKLVSMIDGSYKAKSFKLATDWEIEQIVELEKRFKSIRLQLKNLTKMHRLLSYASDADGSRIEAINLKERIEININSIPEMKKILVAARGKI